MSLEFTSSEMMSVTAARALNNSMTCFVGIGVPSEAANLARLTHAPDVTLIYESGTLQTKPDALPLSIGDGELCESALTTVSVPEMFRYWLQGGHISVGFLGTRPNRPLCQPQHDPDRRLSRTQGSIARRRRTRNCDKCKRSVCYGETLQTHVCQRC